MQQCSTQKWTIGISILVILSLHSVASSSFEDRDDVVTLELLERYLVDSERYGRAEGQVCSRENEEKCRNDVQRKFNQFIRHVKDVSRKETCHEKYQAINPIDLYDPCCLETSATLFLKVADISISHNRNRANRLDFDFSTDITDEKQKLYQDYNLKQLNSLSEIRQLAKQFDTSDFSPLMKRKFKKITTTMDSDNENIRNKLEEASQTIESLYNHAKACPEGMECLEAGEIGPEKAITKTDDYDKLASIWKAWRDVTGPKMKEHYSKMVKLRNVGAKENGYADAGTFEWTDDMEVSDFPEKALGFMEEILPLYQQIHAYVRYRLLQKYPGRFDPDGPIPAHILGNVWAQQWDVIEFVQPYPNAPSAAVSKKIAELGKSGKLTHTDMFRMADRFYQSIGLPPMTDTFWKKSVFEQPKGKLMQCHGSASDFSNNYDFRLKMCTRFNQDDLKTVHHEMGHIQYYMAYNAEQPAIFRGSANSGFHEAIGDTIALSFNTPEHLKKIGLLDEIPETKDFDINYLMKVALEKVVFLPFALTVDFWRWKVANGTISKENYNKAWWDMRAKFQGLMPPVPREKEDCDPMAKYHVAFNVFYIRYFVSFIIQFQFYESLCETADYQGPLHRCDYYEKNVGENLQKMMALGLSKPWPKALAVLTGTEEMKTASLLHYFDPLYQWLKKENAKNGVKIGWNIPNMPVK